MDVPPVGEETHARASLILRFLAEAFARDDSVERLSLDQAGWRTLTKIACTVNIPRSQVYGEPRWGHAYGRPIETLLGAGLIEYRRFPGKGRGGVITKFRVLPEKEQVRELLRENSSLLIRV